MTKIDEAALHGLATKLQELELSDNEQQLLDQLLERAQAFEPETQGFVASEDELIAILGDAHAGLSTFGLKIGHAAGLFFDEADALYKNPDNSGRG